MDAEIPLRFTPSTIAPSRSGSVRAWAACGAISIGLHASMLATVPSGGGAEAARAAASSAMMVRLAILPASNAGMVPTWDPAPLVPQTYARFPDSPKLLPMSIAEPPAKAFDESAYVPARQLTVRPTAAHRISVPYPREAREEGARKAVLAIFIGEDGSVAKVRLRDALPAAFERAAVDAFATARFNPGRIGNTPVKSRVLVQVEFDSGPPEAQEPPRLASVPGKR